MKQKSRFKKPYIIYLTKGYLGNNYPAIIICAKRIFQIMISINKAIPAAILETAGIFLKHFKKKSA